jgi:histidine triad (HIT) family protein
MSNSSSSSSSPSSSPAAAGQPDCLFCKIRDGQIPATIVYRDERVLAFKDTGPRAPFHQLVIPLAHVETLGEADPAHEALLGHLMLTAAKLARDAGHGDKGFRVVMNSGVGAGQTVFHMHLHVLAGRSFGWPPG